MRRYHRHAVLRGVLAIAFFGPATLGGSDISQGGRYDQIIQALMSQFPGLRGLQGQAAGSPQTLGQEGYTFPGNNLYSGQGANIYGGLGLFEGSSAGQPESLTAGLATGALGKSSSQTPVTAAQPQQQPLSSPSLATFGNQSALGFGGAAAGQSSFDQGGGGGGGGTSINIGDLFNTVRAGNNLYNQFSGSQQQQTLPAGLTQNEAGQFNTFTGQANSPVTVQPDQLFGGIGGPSLEGAKWEGGGQLMSPETWQNLQNFGAGGGGGGGGAGTGAESGLSALGAVGAGLGTAASLNALIQGAQTGNPLSIGGGLAGLYTSGAPLANAAFGTSLPTVGGLLTSGLNALPTTLAGAGASAGEGVIGGLEAGVGAGTEGLVAGTSAALGAASALAAPVVIAGTDALMHPNETGDLLRAYTFGAFDSKGGGWLNELLGSTPEKSGKVKELEGIMKDYGNQLPTYAEGLQLPNMYANLPTDPAQRGQALQDLYAKASNILNQGPAMSRAESTIKNAAGSTGIDLSYLNQNSATIAQNAMATLIKTGDELSKMGLQPPVNGLAPMEAAQWGGMYGGLPTAQNPAYNPASLYPGVDPDLVAKAMQTGDFTDLQQLGFSNTPQDLTAGFTPGNYEQALNQYVGQYGGNFGASSLGQILANLGHPMAGGTNPGALTPDMEAQIAALFKQAA